MLTIPLQINNEDITTSKIIEVTNPSTGEVIHHASSAGIEEATQAVEAAQAAFPSWSSLPYDQKRNIFLRAADILERRTSEVWKYEQEETGAVSQYAEAFDVPIAVSGLRDIAGRISGIQGSVPMLTDNGKSALVLKEPYGAILGIVPWNATFILGFRAATFALAAGNTVVLKASELAPRSLGVVGTVFREAGLPAGALNIIQTHPSDAAPVTKALIEHPAIRKINFTGSTAVGRIIAKLAAENLKPVLLELGGKAPAIVLDDADLSVAAQACAVGAFLHTGQICMATERIIVQRSISEQFAKALSGAIESIFPSSAEAMVNVSTAGVVKNTNLVQDATSKGGEIVFGDITKPDSSPYRMRPIVIKNVTKSMDIYYTESFGPTVSFIEVDTEDEAIEIANDTEYGLSSAVFTKDLLRGLRLAKRVKSGAVHINSMSVHDEPALPHGGVKSSGWGRFGAGGLEEWVQTKTVTFMN